MYYFCGVKINIMELSEFQLELLDKINNNTSSELSWLVEENYHNHAKFIEVLNLIKYLEDEGAIAFTNGGFFFVTKDIQKDRIELIVNSYGLTDSLVEVYRKLRNNNYTKTSKLNTIMTSSKKNDVIVDKISENIQVNKTNGRNSSKWSFIMSIIAFLTLVVTVCFGVKTTINSKEIEDVKKVNQNLIEEKAEIENRLTNIENTIKNDSLSDTNAIR